MKHVRGILPRRKIAKSSVTTEISFMTVSEDQEATMMTTNTWTLEIVSGYDERVAAFPRA